MAYACPKYIFLHKFLHIYFPCPAYALLRMLPRLICMQCQADLDLPEPGKTKDSVVLCAQVCGQQDYE